MDIRKQQRLNSQTSKNSVNTDDFIKVQMEGTTRLLPSDQFNKTVNLSTRFNDERNSNNFYRVIGNINPIMTNALFNLNDTTKNDAFTYKAFNGIKFLDTSYPTDNDTIDATDYTYPDAFKNYLVEKEGWFGYYNPDKNAPQLCNFFDMEPKRERFSFIPDTMPWHPTPTQVNPDKTEVKNWELILTYPQKIDNTHYMVFSQNSIGQNFTGLIIIEDINITVGNRLMTGFGMPCKHNLNVGDSVRITGTTGYDGIHTVVSVGLENGEQKDYYFVIDLPPTGSVGPDSRIAKVIDNVESTYYFRIFKKIKMKNQQTVKTNDYEAYHLAFSKNSYSDEIIQFVFNEDVDTSELVDNLNRPLSEIFLTVVKTDSNGLFGRVSSGIETPYIEKINQSNIPATSYLLKIPAINKIHNGAGLPFPTHVPLEPFVSIDNTNLVPNNDYFYGDLVEYNTNTLLETVLADVQHRFNTNNREDLQNPPISLTYNLNVGPTPAPTTISLGPRQEGYYYKAHYQMKIRQFSSYIETGDINTVGVPAYATYMNDGRYLWRDLLDMGISEGTNLIDLPFLNNSHYLTNNFLIYLKRQDPLNLWNLFYYKFPSDPIGLKIIDKFNVYSAEVNC